MKCISNFDLKKKIESLNNWLYNLNSSIISNQVIASTTGIFSGPYFPAFGLTTGRYRVSLSIQSECGKIRTSVFRHFSRSGETEDTVCKHGRDRSGRLKMFFKRGVLLKSFLKKRFQYRWFLVNIANFLRTSFYRTLAVAASGKKTSSRKQRRIGTLSNIFDVASF